MSRMFNTDWKRSYWPEPRLGAKRETRGAVVRRVRGAKREQLEAAREQKLRDALAAD